MTSPQQSDYNLIQRRWHLRSRPGDGHVPGGLPV